MKTREQELSELLTEQYHDLSNACVEMSVKNAVKLDEIVKNIVNFSIQYHDLKK